MNSLIIEEIDKLIELAKECGREEYRFFCPREDLDEFTLELLNQKATLLELLEKELL